MVRIKRSIFETNSSSTHSITICDLTEFNDWGDGKLYYYISDGTLKKPKDINFIMKRTVNARDWHGFNRENTQKLLVNNGFYTKEAYKELIVCENYEAFEEIHTTSGGEKVIAFGYYGCD